MKNPRPSPRVLTLSIANAPLWPSGAASRYSTYPQPQDVPQAGAPQAGSHPHAGSQQLDEQQLFLREKSFLSKPPRFLQQGVAQGSQQLGASQPQLGAASQQLGASQPQLGAALQQLGAASQPQLGAASQQGAGAPQAGSQQDGAPHGSQHDEAFLQRLNNLRRGLQHDFLRRLKRPPRVQDGSQQLEQLSHQDGVDVQHVPQTTAGAPQVGSQPQLPQPIENRPALAVLALKSAAIAKIAGATTRTFMGGLLLRCLQQNFCKRTHFPDWTSLWLRDISVLRQLVQENSHTG